MGWQEQGSPWKPYRNPLLQQWIGSPPSLSSPGLTLGSAAPVARSSRQPRGWAGGLDASPPCGARAGARPPEVTAAPSWLWTSGDVGQGSHRRGISPGRHHGHSPGTRGRHRARSPRHHRTIQDGRQPWLCSTPSCRERAPGPEQPPPCLRAGRPRGCCKEPKGLRQEQGSPGGLAGPGPPRCERGRSLWGCSAGALSLLSLLQPLEVRQVQAANNLLKPDVLA